MTDSFVCRLLRGTLYAVFAAGALMVVTMPWMLDYYMKITYDTYSLLPGYRLFITIFLMMVGVLGLWIVAELIVMMRTVAGDPFVKRNVRALRRTGVVALMLAVAFLGKCFFYTTPLTLACGLLLILCSLVVFTLADLFRQAVAYKEENDLTI